MTNFDAIAQKYDQEYSHSLPGRALRQQVHNYLEKLTPPLNKTVLDIGCGTGEDAIWFARKGWQVTAIDTSANMIEIATQKAKEENLLSTINFYQCDVKDLSILRNEKFDLIFSNFGVLNCESPTSLSNLFAALHPLLNPEGKIILVVMPKFCLMESLYMSYKLSFKNIFRRNTNTALAVPVSGLMVNTWFHSPAELIRYSAQNYIHFYHYPIGLFIPPSYLFPLCAKFPTFTRYMIWLDRKMSSFCFLSYCSDHFIIMFKAK